MPLSGSIWVSTCDPKPPQKTDVNMPSGHGQHRVGALDLALIIVARRNSIWKAAKLLTTTALSGRRCQRVNFKLRQTEYISKNSGI